MGHTKNFVVRWNDKTIGSWNKKHLYNLLINILHIYNIAQNIQFGLLLNFCHCSYSHKLAPTTTCSTTLGYYATIVAKNFGHYQHILSDDEHIFQNISLSLCILLPYVYVRTSNYECRTSLRDNWRVQLNKSFTGARRIWQARHV